MKNIEQKAEIVKQKFSEFMNEMAATEPANIKWNKTNKKWEGVFEVLDTNFNILINKNDTYCDNLSIWEFKFTRGNSTAMHNDYKYVFTVVPTIKLAMETFLKEKKPEVLGFIGNKNDKSRVKMYEKNGKYYADKFKYNYFTNFDYDEFIYVLYKNDKFLDCLDDILSSK